MRSKPYPPMVLAVAALCISLAALTIAIIQQSQLIEKQQHIIAMQPSVPKRLFPQAAPMTGADANRYLADHPAATRCTRITDMPAQWPKGARQ